MPCISAYVRVRLLLLVAAILAVWLSAAVAAENDARQSPSVQPRDGRIVFRVVAVEDEDEEPATAGREAARQLVAAMGDVPLKAVLVSECFEDLEAKQQMLQGLCSVIPREIVFGGATYGSFTQQGCTDFDSLCLLGIGGTGVSVTTALVTEMGVSKLTFEEHEERIKKRLRASGAKLAAKLHRTDQDRLVVLMADAHSPKNQYLVEGVQEVVGVDFPITGGCANKNAGQTFVYFRGRPYQDSAVALMLSGDFRVALAGKKAMDNDRVIATAREGAAEGLARLRGEPAVVLAFNCAGRRGKLRRPEDELAAIQTALGKQVPLFGCYCAGEIGPLDASEKQEGVRCGGSGWHVMFAIIGR